MLNWLVVSTHLKNISQNGNLPQIEVKIKNVWNHHLVNIRIIPNVPLQKRRKSLLKQKNAHQQKQERHSLAPTPMPMLIELLLLLHHKCHSYTGPKCSRMMRTPWNRNSLCFLFKFKLNAARNIVSPFFGGTFFGARTQWISPQIARHGIRVSNKKICAPPVRPIF